jgi:hypothetical protein
MARGENNPGGRRPREPAPFRGSGAEATMRALLDAHGGDVAAATVDWQAIKAEADAQLERDLEVARTCCRFCQRREAWTS